jgi:3-oxoacyl-[acyl-carrier protein] reductase
MSERTFLITGTSRGLGKAMAEYFLSHGERVVGCARSEQTFSHPFYQHYILDISSSDAITDFFFELRKGVKHLDVLINNAGIAKMNALATTPIESVQKIFSVNVFATFLFCQKAIGLLRKSPHPRIINMSTVAVPLRLEGEAAYAASKSAVETLTRIMAKEFGGFRITCNAIGPTPIATDLIKGVGEEKISRLIQQQAIKKMATVDDVLHLADFLCQPASGMITGQVIYLGGIS